MFAYMKTYRRKQTQALCFVKKISKNNPSNGFEYIFVSKLSLPASGEASVRVELIYAQLVIVSGVIFLKINSKEKRKRVRSN